VATVTPNFALLEMSQPEVASLVAAMVQARDAVERRSWSYPQAPTTEEWWADVLADPRARKRERRTDLAVKQAFYRLADEKRETILVACSKCDWRAAFSRDDLVASHANSTSRTWSNSRFRRRACAMLSCSSTPSTVNAAGLPRPEPAGGRAISPSILLSRGCNRADAFRNRFGGQCFTYAPPKPKPRISATSLDAPAAKREEG
jgi:hypothetical protein